MLRVAQRAQIREEGLKPLAGSLDDCVCKLGFTATRLNGGLACVCPAGAGFQRVGSVQSCSRCELGKFKPDEAEWDTLCQPLQPCPPGERRLGAYGHFAGTCSVCVGCGAAMLRRE